MTTSTSVTAWSRNCSEALFPEDRERFELGSSGWPRNASQSMEEVVVVGQTSGEAGRSAGRIMSVPRCGASIAGRCP
jgi:hypothetical protein